MNQIIIENLVELGVFKSRKLSEDEYNELSKNNQNSGLIYISGDIDESKGIYEKYYKEINTFNLTEDEVKLQLDICRTKYLKFIKNFIQFIIAMIVFGGLVMFLIIFH